MAKLLRDVRFVSGIINEDLIFGFEIFVRAKLICYFDDVIFYTQRLDSISHPATFHKHPNSLLFRSYKTNCDFLLGLLNRGDLAPIYPLVQRCIAYNAPTLFFCYSKDRSLSTRQYLRQFFPYIGIMPKFAYYLPRTKNFLSKIKSYIS